MNKALKDLIRISNATGKDPALVQGGGGNTSVKTDDNKYMFIKASGTALKDMNAEHGWRRLRLNKVLEIVKDKNLAGQPARTRELEAVHQLLLACDDRIASEVRPSIETPLHAILGKYVIHLHPVAVLSYACAKNGRAEIEKLFKSAGFAAIWVPYTESGVMLANKIAKLADEHQSRLGKKPSVFFLQKHGIFVSANSPDAALRLVRTVIKRCATRLNWPKPGKIRPPKQEIIIETKLQIRRAIFEATGQYTAISYFYDGPIGAFFRRRDAEKILSSGAFAAGELVYTNGPAVWIEQPDSKKIKEQITLRIKKWDQPPLAFLVKGEGLFVAGDYKHAATVREIVEGSFVIRINASRMGGIVGLSKAERDFVNQGEATPHQKNLTGANELQGRIAVVTGAGSGLGGSIAIGLAKAGAMVALVDIDKKEAHQTAKKIRNPKSEIRNSQTMVVQCDVTNEASVDKAFETLLKQWGGLDILVNAAGVAPPYALIDMPADKWRYALDVNLTGYFLMARAAAKIMIRQGMGGSIINLSSKSGLEPSKNNTAYTTTKAGELAMARGWAMELGECGIRVNCVAPGNVFEGSKIWNPGYIKQCAKKYSIKPEEVISYYVNKTALKREIKGQDIADAVVFLCSDKARTITGQTMKERTVVNCLIKAGDEIKRGDVIFEIETDKANIEMESPCDGFVKHILVEVGQSLPVGAPMLLIGDRDEQVPRNFTDSPKAVADAAISAVVETPRTKPARPTETPAKVTASPRAKKLAEELGADLSKIIGTGPAGKITEDDVKKAASTKVTTQSTAPAKVNLADTIPLTKKQRLTAERMLESKRQIPCFYLSLRADVTDLVELRSKLNETERAKISYNDFIIRAVAIAMEKFPIMTGQLVGDAIKLADTINIGLAVSTPNGLIVPVIKDAHKMNLKQIAVTTKTLAEKARNEKLLLTDLEGACITVSNLGAFGVESFIPVVIPGQCSILGIGRITDTTMPNKGDRKLMSMTLSVDHKVVNGDYAAQFLDFIKKLLEDSASPAV